MNALLTLTQWLSPAFPIGAFAHSQGLEAAISGGHVTDAASLQDWIEDVLRFGSGRNDAIFLMAARKEGDLAELSNLARAYMPSQGRALEAAQLAGIAVTDEAMAVERLGLHPALVEGREDNLKVTTPADLALVEFLLARTP